MGPGSIRSDSLNRICWAFALLAGTTLGSLSCGDDEVTSDSDMADADVSDSHWLLHVPSPAWQDQIIYFIMIDRFDDGDPSNNDQGAGEYDPEDDARYSGGDLRGIIDRLDYIQSLGATAIWITPPVANQWWDPLSQFGGYHGYWGRHFKQVDEHYGTIETYRELSDAIHRRGMYLIQDIVPNHTGNFFTYEGDYDPENPTENFLLNTESLPTAAPEQAPFDRNDVTDPEHREAAIYHWTPAIADYLDLEQQYSYQVSDLDDLNTENPVVRTALRDSYGYWIREVGVDGFRIDTVKFIDHPFWNDFIHSTDADAPGINAVAAETGRSAFLTFGEVFEASDPFDNAGEIKVTSFLGTEESPELMAVLGFPLYEELGRIFSEGRPTNFLTYRLEQFTDRSLYRNPFITPNFIDNHDVQRFLASATEEGFKQALTVLMTVAGIPVIYQGTEQAFTTTRASMFAEGWMSEGEDHFDTDADMYGFIRDLAELRTGNPVFTRGDLSILMDAAAGPGVFVYERTFEGTHALIVLNTAEEPVLLSGLDAGLEAGTVMDARVRMSFEEEVIFGSDGTYLAELPPRTTLVMMPSSEVEAVLVPSATITVDTDLEGETFSDDVEITGTVTPSDTTLVMVLDDYLDRSTPITVESDGSWSVVMPVSQFPYGEMDHHVTVYAPDAKVASPRYACTSDVVFEGEIVTVDDPAGDDHGPTGDYEYPQAGFGNQMDIRRLVIEAGPTTMNLKLTMAEVTDVWNPTNGFDHVCFNVYFDIPDSDGLTYLPRINGTAPEGFAWDFTHFASGWDNSLHSTQEASEDNWGRAVPGAPTISADKPNRLIAFQYNREAFGLETWEGTGIYITTWDWDGIQAIYRPLTPEGGQWVFGGGEEDDPYIMDELGPAVVPVLQE